jgi:hypothetical protein
MNLNNENEIVAPISHDGNSAQIILRSNDNSEIRTFKALLSQALAVTPIDTDASIAAVTVVLQPSTRAE